ncbi:ATP-binding protein [Thermosulfurimonas sp. F29]|uniref:ATP-binding protein n=1 Tax=Thermosulfurimonas sp. F29 TaxID=2867247 RepID=UPI001C833A9F|nr:4Fe-4S binding protein [Thermosulfurimonas sp. F29]MBX6422620.1 4Fe-4S binding protein [Thermosulfurimonas sp. F29]
MARTLRKIIEIDEELCDGCGQCVTACEEGAIQIVNGKARLVAEKLCDGLGACIGECPRGALRIVEREAEPFDHHAVEEHLKRLRAEEKPLKLACGCPGSQVREFAPVKAPAAPGHIPSALTQWPVQIRLVPPSAPFLKGADLLVAADCVPVAYPELHTRLLPGKKILIGCPKFDPAEEYVARLSEVLRQARPGSVTLAIMEVPCCRGLALILEEARRRAETNIPIRVVVISARGEVVREEEL